MTDTTDMTDTSVYDQERDALDTEEMLLRGRELVDAARSVPMSASVMVNRDELLSLLDDALNMLPEELRQARWLLKEREEFLAKARREADDIIDSGRQQAERMVERTEVVREARRRAQKLVDDAEAQSRALKHEAEDYIDQKLATFEVVLERTMQAVHKGRERLQVVVDLPAAEEADESLEGNAFFDQDRD